MVVRVSKAGGGAQRALRGSPEDRGDGSTPARGTAACQRKAIAARRAKGREIFSVEEIMRFLGSVNESKKENEG